MNRCFVILWLIALASCNKHKESPAPPPAPAKSSTNINLIITNFAGSSILNLSKDSVYTGSSTKYLNANNDTFSVSKFTYYLSNFRLKTSTGNYYNEPDSYHLLDASDSLGSCHWMMPDVPTGTYSALEFLIGIDSARNCSGAQTGALDPVLDMFWNWNQGYIFMKFEGYSSSAPPLSVHNLSWHLGGFTSPYINYKPVSITFPTAIDFDGSKIPKIHLKADIQELFKTPTVLSFSAAPNITSLSGAKPVADNYADMFSLKSIAN